MEILSLIIRILHILCSVFWAGTVLYVAAFVMPAVEAAGAEGKKFMQVLSGTNGFPVVMSLASTLSILTGIYLVWDLSENFRPEWFGTPYGISLSVGGTAALIAYLVGFLISRPAVTKMAAIGQTIASAGSPPLPDQVREMNRLKDVLKTATGIVAILLLVAIIGMAAARYV